MTKTNVVREFIANNPEVLKKDLHIKIYEKHPDIFGTKKKAWAVVQNAFKYGAAQKPCRDNRTSAAITEGQLREMFDVRTIVLKELETINKGEFWKDADLVRRFQGKGAYRSVLESPEAQKYKGKAGGQVFWSHPESIAKMKLEGVLI